jgi:hypothetical protein
MNAVFFGSVRDRLRALGGEHLSHGGLRTALYALAADYKKELAAPVVQREETIMS